MATRECDAIGCTAGVASGRFMCLGHWRAVPRPLQDTINRRYRALRSGFAFLSDVEYLTAAVDAIDVIAAREGKQGVNPYRRHLVLAQRRAGGHSAEAERHQAAMTTTILTSQGTYFDFEHPERSVINVEIVAHALSHLCRFTGHCLDFYSVAQHAVVVSHLVPPEFAWEGLHHDDGEAFIGDMVSPLKKLIPGFKELERRVDAVVWRHFGLPEVLPPEVKRADLVALRTEQRDLMHQAGGLWTSLHGIDPAPHIKIVPMAPALARQAYLDRHAELLSQREGARA